MGIQRAARGERPSQRGGPAPRVTILLDHQPPRAGQTLGRGIDLQVSGHAHHGQLWPLNLITGAMYEVSQGHRQLGHGHIFVSTGFGTWGPPARVGNRPEIAIIRISARQP